MWGLCWSGIRFGPGNTSVFQFLRCEGTLCLLLATDLFIFLENDHTGFGEKAWSRLSPEVIRYAGGRWVGKAVNAGV